MASTYGNDLRLEEIGDGEQSGTWGATTNTNLELIAEALSFGTEAITTNADTHTTTIADGATDPGRSLYLKYTGTLDSTCTITIAPNSISKTWYIENGTSGSQSIIISQGSGANVTIPTGQTKIVYSDGAGSGAAMAEIGTLGVTNLNVSGDITVGDDLTVTDDAAIGGALTVTGVLTGTSLDISGNVDIDGTLETDALSINSTAVTSTAAELNILDGVTATTAELNIMDGVTSTTAELNILDGVTSTTAELNILDGVTSNATEINQLDAITRGSILYGNASGVTARLAKGTAGTVLTSDGTDLSFASIAAGMSDVIFPSDWASPTNNYTSSGTWSKGSLSDDDYVWIYLLGSGGGGGARYTGVGDITNGGAGGYALLIYGQAKYFNGGAYVVGASKAGTNTGGSNNDYTGTPGNASTFTLTSTYNSQVYTTASGTDNGTGDGAPDDTTAGRVLRYNPTIDDVIDLTNLTPDFTITSNVNYSEITDKGLPTGVTARYSPKERWYNITGTPYSIFGGGQGSSEYNNTINPAGTSMFAGAGGAIGSSLGGSGAAPGGGGGGVTASNGVGGTGAQGSVRIYHV